MFKLFQFIVFFLFQWQLTHYSVIVFIRITNNDVTIVAVQIELAFPKKLSYSCNCSNVSRENIYTTNTARWDVRSFWTISWLCKIGLRLQKSSYLFRLTRLLQKESQNFMHQNITCYHLWTSQYLYQFKCLRKDIDYYILKSLRGSWSIHNLPFKVNPQWKKQNYAADTSIMKVTKHPQGHIWLEKHNWVSFDLLNLCIE